MSKAPMTTAVTAKYDDLRDPFCLMIILEHDSAAGPFDPVMAVRAAVREYAESSAGQADKQIRSDDFNWGDFVNSVPEEICLRHGFRVEDTVVSHCVVVHDDVLLD